MKRGACGKSGRKEQKEELQTGVMSEFLQSRLEGREDGHLATLFQDFERVDVSVPGIVINLHPEEAWSQQLQTFRDTGCQSLRRHRDPFPSSQEIGTR